uniref:Uncharacterized protein n=1 Tax=Anguilla anguilla TaxID=7936 RepID=A0A0E9QTS6_ANGAN
MQCGVLCGGCVGRSGWERLLNACNVM